jgi:hypothetical protein
MQRKYNSQYQSRNNKSVIFHKILKMRVEMKLAKVPD